MSASGDFGPAPAGVDLSENQDVNMRGAIITLMIFGTVAVTLRIIARLKMKNVRLSIDDYLICCALLFSYSMAICTFISIPYGNGRHLQALTLDDFTTVWKVLFAYVIIYACGVTCTKASIVMFYHRIFNLGYLLYLLMFLVVGYWLTIVITIFVACRPLPYFWEQYTTPTAKGTCIDVPKFFLGNGIAAMFIDIFILSVPIPIVWNLQMRKSQKLAVVGILLLGSFVCVASLVRIIMLDRNTQGKDPTWTMGPVFVWSCVEPFIGIVCACLPVFGPYFRRFLARIRTGISDGSGKKDGVPGVDSESQPRGERDRRHNPRKLGPNGDEIELMTEISGENTAYKEWRTDEEAQGHPGSGIMVKKTVQMSWNENA